MENAWKNMLPRLLLLSNIGKCCESVSRGVRLEQADAAEADRPLQFTGYSARYIGAG